MVAKKYIVKCLYNNQALLVSYSLPYNIRSNRQSHSTIQYPCILNTWIALTNQLKKVGKGNKIAVSGEHRLRDILSNFMICISHEPHGMKFAFFFIGCFTSSFSTCPLTWLSMSSVISFFFLFLFGTIIPIFSTIIQIQPWLTMTHSQHQQCSKFVSLFLSCRIMSSTLEMP